VRSRLRGSNTWKLWLVVAAAGVVTLVGVHHVWIAQRPLFLKREVFVELQKNRRLVREREVLEREVAELRATPRVALRATEILNMRPPRPDERIVVPGNEGDAR